MNRIYRLVFNRSTGLMQVASELATAPSSSASSSITTRRRSTLSVAMGMALCLSAAAPSAFAQVYNFDSDDIITDSRGYTEGFNVGRNGPVTVTVLNGGELTSNATVSLGTSAAGSGNLILNGTIAWLNLNGASSTLRVGDAGNGHLAVQGGSTVTTAGFLALGQQAGSTGSALIDGTGSAITARRALVGRAGSGTLDITAGGILTTTEAFTTVNNYGMSIGAEAGSTGTVNVGNGGRITVTDNNLLVGQVGTGTLNINAQGTVDVGRNAYIGAAADSTGTVQVNAAGQLNAQQVVVGFAQDATGTLNVSGANARVDTGSLWVASSGSGALRVDNGGVVTATTEVIAERYDGIGSGSMGQTGSIVVSGAGSMIDAASGDVRSTNHLRVEAGGSIRSASARIKDSYGPVASTATITGAGSNWTNSGFMDVRSGLDVLDGGLVSSDTISIAGGLNGATMTPQVVHEQARVSGAGSQLKAADGITVGGIIGEPMGVLGADNGGLVDGGTGITLETLGYLVLGGGMDQWSNAQGQPQWRAADVAGVLGSGAITMNSASGGLVFNHTGAISLANTVVSEQTGAWQAGALTQLAGSTTLNGDLTGFGGDVTVSGGLLQIDSNLYTGQGYTDLSQVSPQQFDISGGTLVLNGSAGFQQTINYGPGFDPAVIRTNNVMVRNGGVLAGNATVGTTHVLNGGILAPGAVSGNDQIGAITIDGDLYLNAGATLTSDVAQAAIYDVQLRANGQADKLTVTGKAYIGSTAATGYSGIAALRVSSLDPETSYQSPQTYAVLDAAGGVQGGFDTLLSNSAFLQATTAQVGGDVVVAINVNNVGGPGPVDPGTPVDPTDPTNPTNPVTPPAPGAAGPIVFGRVASTSNQRGVAAGLDSLQQSGEALALYNGLLMLDEASALTAFDELSGELHGSARAMLLEDRFLRDGIAQRLRPQPGSNAEGVSAWVAGSGTSTRRDGDGTAARVQQTREGLMAGADWTVDNRWTVGIAAGSESLDQQIHDRNARTDVDAVHAGLYAGFRGESFWMNGGLSYADYELDTHRSLGAGRAWSQTLEGRYDADAQSAFTEGGWDFGFDRLTLTPYVALAYTRLSTDAAVESGGSAALAVDASKDEVWTTTAGLRAAWDISGGQRDGARLEAGLAWQNAAGELRADSRNRFVVGSDRFTVSGLPLARNVGIAELGVSLKPTDNSRLSFHAQGRAGDGQREFGAQLNWNLAF